MFDRTKLSEALDWVEHGKPMKDGTALSERQGLITQAARKYLALMPDEDGNPYAPAEIQELAGGTLRCHYDQKEKVHYIGVFDDGGGAASRMALIGLRLLQTVLDLINGDSQA